MSKGTNSLHVHHVQPDGLTKEQQQRLDELTSESMDLYFKLEDSGIEDADLVLLQGIDIAIT